MKNKNILFSTALNEYRDIFQEVLNKKFKKAEFIESFAPFDEKGLLHIKIFRELYKTFPKIKYFEKLYDKVASTEYKKTISSYEEEFDYFLVVSSGKFSNGYLKELKKKNPNIKTVLFLWDKLSYTSWGVYIDSFDYVFTFDRNDAKKYGYYFRPTFYTGYNKGKEIEYSKRENSIYYIGLLRDISRYKFSKKLSDYMNTLKEKALIKLYVPKKRKLNILSEDYDKELITMKKIKFYEDLDNTRNSKVILDLSYGEQIGLTLRCLNAIESNTKILTNNKDIVNYDFYNEDNIRIIDKVEDIEKIDIEFFRTESQKLDENIKHRYSIEGFIEEIVNTIEK